MSKKNQNQLEIKPEAQQQQGNPELKPIIEEAQKTRAELVKTLRESADSYNKLVANKASVDKLNEGMKTIVDNLTAVNKKIWDERFAEVLKAENPMKELLLKPMTEIYVKRSPQGKNVIGTIEINCDWQFVSLDKYDEYCNLKKLKGYSSAQWHFVIGGIKSALIAYAAGLNVDNDSLPKGVSKVKLFEAQAALQIQHSDKVSKKDMTAMLQYVLDCWIGEGEHKVMEQDAKVLRETYFKFAKPKNNNSEAEIVNINDKTFVEHLMHVLKRVVTGGKFKVRIK